MLQDSSSVSSKIQEYLSNSRISNSNNQASFRELGLDDSQLKGLCEHLQIEIPEVDVAKVGVYSMDTILDLSRYIAFELDNKSKDVGYYQGALDLLVERFADVSKVSPKKVSPSCSALTNYMITGANGRLGVFLVKELLELESTGKLYCLVRGEDSATCLQRIKETLNIYGFKFSVKQWEKVVALPYATEDPMLGLSDKQYMELLSDVNIIYHVAWAVNHKKGLFNMRNCIAATRNLLDFSVNSPNNPQFNFYSSIMAVAGVTGVAPTIVLADRLSTKIILKEACSGYGLSKLVAEEVCYKYSELSHLNINIFRVGQVSGDSVTGIWNFNEVWPLLLKTSLEIKCCTESDFDGLVSFNFTPADIATKSIHEIACKTIGSSNITVAHIINKKHSYIKLVATSLNKMGYEIELVDPMTFADKLANLNRKHKQQINQHKSLDKALRVYDSGEAFVLLSLKNRIMAYADHEDTCRRSEVLNNCPEMDFSLIAKYVERWVEQGYLDPPPTKAK